MKKITLILILILFLFPINIFSQNKEETNLFNESTFSGLKFRNIGPAFMSGRIADIAIHPANQNIWIVGVGSGGVWKTENAGTTWESIFDGQGSYSIGCVTIDSNNPNIVWVGTGENVGGRHVGYGDGIYKSSDEGKTWSNMGLKESQHISKILVHPNNSDIIWVASQGPLWSKGGDRGLYKSTDGGNSWKKTLGDSEWVGVTDVIIDPRNPDCLYAATWQRNRNVAAYISGGPGTGIYKSTNGGESWEKLTNGLPKTNMGKIGLAISPQKPDNIYAAIELDRRTGGVYKSTNSGASWTKQSDAVAGATGPHYYQELCASPYEFDRIYLVDFRIQISEDGGKTFKPMQEDFKHSDNHSIAFKNDDPNYLLVGTDGGIYETFDLARTWKFIPNLPVTQFYKVAVDDKEPFYNIYGGTQDNSTQGGPSRTDNINGIRNSDWEIVLFADGHQPATEPGNPNIVYAEWQQGNLVRTDRVSGEIVYIQPQPDEGELAERFNWDAPILVSPHSPKRLYYASQRVWRSDDRGDSWKAISDDLTRNQERATLPIMDKTWSYDSPWDFDAMSTYNTITSLAESPVQEGIIYAGTDDGIIQVTEDGGKSWRKINVSDLPGVPATSFVNDIKADLFDVNTVYVALDNHKFGDFTPYLYKSVDRGKSWKSIRSNIANRTLVWRLVQDHIKPELLFVATEFGVYFTIDGGKLWTKFTGGLPTISFRDLAIQRRENDLIAASFGRGFFILDDYSSLRELTQEKLKEEAILFPVKKAWWYIPRTPIGNEEQGSMGAQLYLGSNPSFGAEFTYYIGLEYNTLKKLRKEKEKELIQNGKNIPFQGWEALEQERMQVEPKIWLTITDKEGNVIRKMEGPKEKGFHRVAWDLKTSPYDIIAPNRLKSERQPEGAMIAPDVYYVILSKEIDGKITDLSEPMEFKVEQLRKGTLKGSPTDETAEFWNDLEKFQAKVVAVSITLDQLKKKVDAMILAFSRSNINNEKINERLYELKQEVVGIETTINGNKTKQELGGNDYPTIYSRINVAQMGTKFSTYGPTPTHKKSLDIAKRQYEDIKSKIKKLNEEKLAELEKELIRAGAPWIIGQDLP